MIQLRKSKDRGHANHGWLDTYHTFSFDDYYDPEQMGFRSLRVLNEDRVAAGEGFPTHPHRDMEIITYIIEGALEHKDSIGTGSVIRPGDVQRMSAGTGVRHSEFNHSKTEPVHLIQIWILPEKHSCKPSYEEKKFSAEEKKNCLKLVGSREGKDGSVTIHQDVELYVSLLEQGASVRHGFKPGRSGWLQVAKGELTVNGKPLNAGDGAAIWDEEHLFLEASRDSEFLLFDLA